jgi:hypothetical protein
MNFMDGPWLSYLAFRAMGSIGSIDRERAANLVNAYTLSFLQHHLKITGGTFSLTPTSEVKIHNRDE